MEFLFLFFFLIFLIFFFQWLLHENMAHGRKHKLRAPSLGPETSPRSFYIFLFFFSPLLPLSSPDG